MEPYHHIVSSYSPWLFHAFANGLGEFQGIRLTAILEDQSELVVADAVGLAAFYRVFKEMSHHMEQSITVLIPIAMVETLEIIHIQYKHRTTSRTGKQTIQTSYEHPSGGQTGQHVVSESSVMDQTGDREHRETE
jgi:hypothetical protein